MASAFIVHLNDLYREEITIVAPYNPGFVTDIKMIPPSQREYDPDHKAWKVFEPWIERAMQVVKKHYDGVTDLQYVYIQSTEKWSTFEGRYYNDNNNNTRKQHTYTNTNNEQNKHYTTLGILPTKDAKLIKAAYRVLAQLHHPDTGGNAEAFKTLHESFEWCLRHADP